MARVLRSTLILALCASLSGCLAPKYFGVDRPYDKKTDTIFKTYQAAYDAFVILQLYPVPITAVIDSRWGETGHTIVMSFAAPIAIVGMAIFGTIASPIVLILPDSWINWERLKR